MPTQGGHPLNHDCDDAEIRIMSGGTRLDEVARLRHIIETQKLINSVSLDSDELMRVVTERAQRITRADGAIVELAEGDDMVYRSATGAAAPHLGMRLAMRTSLSGHCLRLGVPIRCDDTELDPRVDREACREVSVRSMIVVPLLKLEIPVGVLKVASKEPHFFDDSDTDILREMAGFIADAMTHASEHRKETHNALHDALTGLPNRYLLAEHLELVCAAAERDSLPVAVFVLDLDGFKAVNDIYGHGAGDDLLKLVAQRLSRILRRADMVARLGGDEFVLVCCGATEADAYRILDRIDSAMRLVAVTTPEFARISASIGVAWRGRDCSTPNELLAAADASMYRVKRAG